jgi:tetratricopeptide (TPR) repeat protein
MPAAPGRYAALLDKQGRYGEQERMLWRLHGISNHVGKDLLTKFYEKMTALYPENPDWLFKRADFMFSHTAGKYAIEMFEQVIVLDSNYSSRAFIHNKAGQFYLGIGLGEPKERAEVESKWEHYQNLAIGHFKQAIERAPDWAAPQNGIAAAYLDLFDYGNALPALESMRRHNRLNFENRLILIDLYSCSGRFTEADTLLKKAQYMQPKLVPDLAEQLGKWYLLQNLPADAAMYYTLESQLRVRVNNSLCYTIARLYARQGLEKEALHWLDLAMENGFLFGRVIRYDPDWENLRNGEPFAALLRKYPMEK